MLSFFRHLTFFNYSGKLTHVCAKFFNRKLAMAATDIDTRRPTSTVSTALRKFSCYSNNTLRANVNGRIFSRNEISNSSSRISKAWPQSEANNTSLAKQLKLHVPDQITFIYKQRAFAINHNFQVKLIKKIKKQGFLCLRRVHAAIQYPFPAITSRI